MILRRSAGMVRQEQRNSSMPGVRACPPIPTGSEPRWGNRVTALPRYATHVAPLTGDMAYIFFHPPSQRVDPCAPVPDISSAGTACVVIVLRNSELHLAKTRMFRSDGKRLKERLWMRHLSAAGLCVE